MMCLLNVYLVCNHATECKKDGCKKRSAYTLRICTLIMIMSHLIEENHQSHVNWEKLSENDINHYQCCCKKLCSDYSYFNEALLCRDTHCSSEAHREQLEELYNNFVSDVVSISNDSFKVSYDSRKKTFKVAPGWNDSVKHAHSSAREAYSMWCHVNRPKNGPYFKIMK